MSISDYLIDQETKGNVEYDDSTNQYKPTNGDDVYQWVSEYMKTKQFEQEFDDAFGQNNA